MTGNIVLFIVLWPLDQLCETPPPPAPSLPLSIDYSRRIFLFSYCFTVTYRLPLGVEDRRIPDSALSSSSRWDTYHGPHRARLNTQRRGRRRGAWSSRANSRNQWLQIDIGTRAVVYGIATQGRQDAGQWVKVYKVMYSKNGVRWRWYQVRRRNMVS